MSTPVRLSVPTEAPRASLRVCWCAGVEEMVAVMEPQEIEDEGHEQILERVAAVDVAKAAGMVCTRVPRQGQPDRRRTRVWAVDAATNAILELADHLATEGIEKVTLESTPVIRGANIINSDIALVGLWRTRP